MNDDWDRPARLSDFERGIVGWPSKTIEQPRAYSPEAHREVHYWFSDRFVIIIGVDDSGDDPIIMFQGHYHRRILSNADDTDGGRAIAEVNRSNPFYQSSKMLLAGNEIDRRNIRMLRRVGVIYDKFGLYQSVRVILGTLLTVAIPVFLVAWIGWLAIWTIPLNCATCFFGIRQGKRAFRNPRALRSHVDHSLRLTIVLMAVGGAFPTALWFLFGLAGATAAFATAALLFSLSDSRIVNLDRIPEE